MKFRPSLNCVLQCSRTSEEIRRMLELVTVQQNKTFFGAGDGEFTGTVSDSGFEIMPRLSYIDSFVPVIRGWMETSGDRSRIRIEMKMVPFASVFYVVWSGATVLCLLCGALSAFAGGTASGLPLLFHSVFMLIMGWIFIKVGFYGPAEKSLKRIKELLGGTEQEGSQDGS